MCAVHVAFIQAERNFIDIAGKVLCAHLVIRAIDAALQERPYALNRVCGRDTALVLTAAVVDHLVVVEVTVQPSVTNVLVSQDGRADLDIIEISTLVRYAYSPERRGGFHIDTLELRRALNTSLDAISPAEQRSAIARLQEMIPQFATDLEEQKKVLATAPQMPEKEYAIEKLDTATPEGQIKKAALDGERRYAHLNCPVLAIFALPHDQGLPPGPKRDAADASDIQTFGPIVDSFAAGVPSARVVRIPHAQHAIYDSNRNEVMHEINRFADGLK
jgi:hypothetical protein